MGRTSQRERPTSAGPVEVRASPTDVGKAGRQEQWSILAGEIREQWVSLPGAGPKKPKLKLGDLLFGARERRWLGLTAHSPEPQAVGYQRNHLLDQSESGEQPIRRSGNATDGARSG